MPRQLYELQNIEITESTSNVPTHPEFSYNHLFFLTTYGVDSAIYDIIPTYYHVITTPAPAYYCVMSICSSSYALTDFFVSILANFQIRTMDSTCYQQNTATIPHTHAQTARCVHVNMPFPILKEHLTDIIDELVSVSKTWNRCTAAEI
jgi:hypothetical protein